MLPKMTKQKDVLPLRQEMAKLLAFVSIADFSPLHFCNGKGVDETVKHGVHPWGIPYSLAVTGARVVQETLFTKSILRFFLTTLDLIGSIWTLFLA